MHHAPWLALLVFAATALAAHAAVAEDPTLIPLRYGVERRMPLGLRIEIAPGVVVAKGGRDGTTVVGYTGYIKLKAYADLVIVKSEVDAYDDGSGAPTRWDIGVHLGGELQPGKLAGHVLGAVRVLARKALHP